MTRYHRPAVFSAVDVADRPDGLGAVAYRRQPHSRHVLVVLRQAHPVILDRHGDAVAGRLQPDRDLPRLGVLEGVVHGLQANVVDVDRRRLILDQRRRIGHELARHAEQARSRSRQLAQRPRQALALEIHRAQAARQAPRLLQHVQDQVADVLDPRRRLFRRATAAPQAAGQGRDHHAHAHQVALDAVVQVLADAPTLALGGLQHFAFGAAALGDVRRDAEHAADLAALIPQRRIARLEQQAAECHLCRDLLAGRRPLDVLHDVPAVAHDLADVAAHHLLAGQAQRLQLALGQRADTAGVQRPDHHRRAVNQLLQSLLAFVQCRPRPQRHQAVGEVVRQFLEDGGLGLVEGVRLRGIDHQGAKRAAAPRQGHRDG